MLSGQNRNLRILINILYAYYIVQLTDSYPLSIIALDQDYNDNQSDVDVTLVWIRTDLCKINVYHLMIFKGK